MLRWSIRVLAFTTLIAASTACGPKAPAFSRDQVIHHVRSMPSALPGMSVEAAVDQILRDMKGHAQVRQGRWYCNPAIEFDDEVYKVGYEFDQNGKTARFGWAFHAEGPRIEPLTDYARQVAP